MWNSIKEQDGQIKAIPRNFNLDGISAMELFRKNRFTLMAVSYSTFSDPAIESFLSASPEKLPKIIVQPILNPLKWILWSKLIISKKNSFSIRGDIPGAIDVFGMENKYAGYVFLIDSFGAILWKAAGMATPEEIEELHKKLKQL